MEIERPLDLLNNCKKVIILLKDYREISATLLAFDIHINLALENAKFTGEEEKKLGLTFLRGDTIISISPEETK